MRTPGEQANYLGTKAVGGPMVAGSAKSSQAHAHGSICRRASRGRAQEHCTEMDGSRLGGGLQRGVLESISGDRSGTARAVRARPGPITVCHGVSLVGRRLRPAADPPFSRRGSALR